MVRLLQDTIGRERAADAFIENIEPISDAASLKGANYVNPRCNRGLGCLPDGTSPRGANNTLWLNLFEAHRVMIDMPPSCTGG